jgi:opacity protein-like surface antigen
MNTAFKKTLVCLTLLAVLGASAQGAKLSLKFSGGGTYLLGGDYNQAMDGWRNYEKTVVGASETFVDNLKKIGLGFRIGAELIYEFNPSLALGLEVGYLGASVESSFSRTWHNYKLTLTPSLSAVPTLLNVHYFMPLGEKLKLHAVAGAGAFLSRLEYGYAIEDINYPYSGTWKPASKTVFGGQIGIGLEYALSASLALTFDVIGRYAEIPGFTGPWSGIYDGVEKSGTATLYYYDYDGTYPMIGLYETPPSGVHLQNVRDAKFSLSGVSALIGIRIGL